jgi:UDPglucose--hexose-1-phosphate uridylyltransferase
MDKSELRMDPLTREWTIFNENRVRPPSRPATAALDPSPFYAGLERFASHSLFHADGAHGWQVRVVPNRVPVLGIEANCAVVEDGVYSRLGGFGAHEIVIEDPGARSFSELAKEDMAKVVEAWRSRIEDLMRDGRMLSFSVVKDEGAEAGQTVAHSVSQIVAMGVVAPSLRIKLDVAQQYFKAQGESLYAKVLAQEMQRSERIVFENDGFVVFCPYASGSPFEVAVWPKRHAADFHKITANEVTELADAIGHAVQKLNKALTTPAFHLTLTTAPSSIARESEWPDADAAFCWHVRIVPRLQPTGGIELATGCHVNTVWPEVAADFLRQQEVQP